MLKFNLFVESACNFVLHPATQLCSVTSSSSMATSLPLSLSLYIYRCNNHKEGQEKERTRRGQRRTKEGTRRCILLSCDVFNSSGVSGFSGSVSLSKHLSSAYCNCQVVTSSRSYVSANSIILHHSVPQDRHH